MSGKPDQADEHDHNALAPGHELVGDFRIERVLGAGGFGTTYLAEETALGRMVAIKEYGSREIASRETNGNLRVRKVHEEDFQWGLDRFIDEAQTLARFDHPNIVRVYRYFRTNNTAYIVLEFEEGQSLEKWLKSLGRAPRQRELDTIVEPLLNALETLHANDFLHRDIAPDNVMVRQDGTPVLIDFGSARGDIAARTKSMSALVKTGYSPYEQYSQSGNRQGPWTDIYSLGATLYRAISGKRPLDAPSRVLRDELESPRDVALASYRSSFLDAIGRALALDIERRPQSVAAWRGDLLAREPVKPSWFARAAASTPMAQRDMTGPQGQPAQVPPPPDAPGTPGGLLDYIEKLNTRSVHGPSVIAQDRPEPLQPAVRRASNQAPGAVVPSRPRPRPARPRPVRNKGAWRWFAVRFIVGAAIAAAAVELSKRIGTTW